MKNSTSILFFLISFLCINNSYAQDYNEKRVLKTLEEYMKNPRAYYEFIKSKDRQVEQANKTSLEVAEDYLRQLSQRDSLLKLYKNKLNTAMRQAAPAQGAVTPTNGGNNANLLSPAASSPVKSAINSANLSSNTAVQKNIPTSNAQNNGANMFDKIAKSNYRVQLASFKMQNFEKYMFLPRTIRFNRLKNRNVFEIAGFGTSEEAYEFAQVMRQSGYSGAFVSYYENDERVEEFDYVKKFNPTTIFPSIGTDNTPKSSKIVGLALDYPKDLPQGYLELTEQLPSNKQIKESINTPASPQKAAPNSLNQNSNVSTFKRDHLDEAFDKIFRK